MTVFEPLTQTNSVPLAGLGRSTSSLDTKLAGAGLTRRLALGLMLIDICAMVLAFAGALAVSALMRDIFGIDSISATFFITDRAKEMVLLIGLTVAIFAFGGLYRRSAWEMDEIRRIVAGIGLVALFDATLQFVLRDHNSRLWFITAYPLAIVMVISLRMAVRQMPMVREAMTNHIVLIGNGVSADSLIYEMRESRSAPVKLLHSLPFGQVAGRDPERLNLLIERLAHRSGIPEHRVTAVLAPTADELIEAQTTLGLLTTAGRTASLILPFTGLARNGVTLQKVIGADMVMAEMRPAAPNALHTLLKRSFDLLAGLVILALISPILIGVALTLTLTERGPVFFRQLRVGKNGRNFWCYKFRSMRLDAQERLEELLATDPAARAEWNETQKLQNDPRITPLGHFIRKTSIDELPQIFNVLTGEMSLVGPRPIISPEIPGYQGDKAYYHSPDFQYYARCTPGITGLWQVSGRSATSHEERVRLDRWYARNWSVWLDLMILFKTVRVVMFGSGSA